MSKFVIPISEKKRRQNLLMGYFLIGLCLYNVTRIVEYFFSEQVGKGERVLAWICMAILMGWLAFARFQKRKRKEWFVQIDEQDIQWVLHETDKPIIANWNDIRSIKRQTENDILFFLESSFSVGFSLKDFRKEDKTQILGLLEQYAVQKQIRLI